ncbi:MAG: MBL fold metallo-hydrolase [Bacteroidales bacterium]|nr:MBL fold metallo-hydrolase [Bacteroidales bacterium]
MKRLLWLFTAVLLLSCSKNSGSSEIDNPTSSGIKLIENNVLCCRVVCASDAPTEAKWAANQINNKLNALSGGSGAIQTSSKGKGAVEIIIGDDAYEDARNDYRAFTYGSYLAKCFDNKIILAAHDSASYHKLATDIGNTLVRHLNGGTLTVQQASMPKAPEAEIKGFIPPFIGKTLPAYVLQTGAVTVDDTAMQVAYENLSFNDFTAYCSDLESQGYKKCCENSMFANKYASYSNGKYLVSVSYYGSTTKLLNIVSELEYGKSIWSISGTKGDVKELMMQVYQDNVIYTQSHPGGYVVRLSDGRYFVYDTGYAKSANQLMEYMHSRNTFKDGKVHIALIIISHPHEDHMKGLIELAAKYKSEIDCDAVAFNMTNHTRQSHYELSTLNKLHDSIVKAAEDLGASCHYLRGGQVMDLAGAKLEVLFTPDELGTYFLSGKNAQGESDTSRDQNNSSNMVRLTVGGQMITFTGDCRGGEAGIFNKLVKPVFKSDIMTVAHHGFNVSATLQMYTQAKPFALFWTIRQDEQDMSRYFDQQLMAATYVKSHFFEEELVEIELPYNPS